MNSETILRFLAGVQAVVFDAVGTLIDADPPAAEVYFRIGRRLGSHLSQEDIAQRFRQAFQTEEQRDRENGWQTSEAREIERWRNLVGQVLDDVSHPAACFQELFEYFARPESWRCQADAWPVLQELARRGFILGLASNYDSRLHSVLQGKPELRPLKHLIISSQVGWRKPAQKFFAAVCRAVDQPPDQILYVGDDPINDYQAARAAGFRAVLFAPNDNDMSTSETWISRLPELIPQGGA